jgi:hypothetical protein
MSSAAKQARSLEDVLGRAAADPDPIAALQAGLIRRPHKVRRIWLMSIDRHERLITILILVGLMPILSGLRQRDRRPLPASRTMSQRSPLAWRRILIGHWI